MTMTKTMTTVIGGTFMTVNYLRYDSRLKNLVAESKDIERFRKYVVKITGECLASQTRAGVTDDKNIWFSNSV